MAKKIETCMFCEATPCECEGAAKPKRTRAPGKKAASVDERSGSGGRVRKPRASVDPDVAREEPVAPVRTRAPAIPDEVRAMRTLHFQGLLAPEEIEKHKDMLTITVEGKLLGEV